MTRLSIHHVASAVMLLSASALGACSTTSAKTPDAGKVEIAASPAPEPPRAVEVVTVPEPLPLPGQLKPVTAGARRPESTDPRQRIGAANAAARVQPTRDGYVNAIQQYPWTEGALYQVYAAPGQVTDIALQEGEQLVGPGPVAAGDTVRWIIGDTVSGAGPTARVHILAKPTRPDIGTNLVINTDRRTYHLELRATPSTYMASVSWTYPQDALIALRGANAAAASAAPVASGLDLAALNFRYRIEGGRVPWKPVRAFDDSAQVFIEFPHQIAQGEMPPLFVTGAAGDAELVNYRVQGRYMVVDRLFAAAELRLGDKRSEQRVRIVRDGAEPRRRGR
ncbi:MAG: P-type conjugative transfer protein TrbG [Caenibius sp.]|nr:MAG: P-type conjugative transfer protein TrbG [Sphingobium sp. 66-54]